MRYIAALAALCLLAACAGPPPKAPLCEGEFVPVNIEQQQHGSVALSRDMSIALCKGGSHVGQG